MLGHLLVTVIGKPYQILPYLVFYEICNMNSWSIVKWLENKSREKHLIYTTYEQVC